MLQSSRWSEDGATCVFQLKGHITPVKTLSFSPDGLALASGGVGGLMNIWSLRVRNPTHRWSRKHPHRLSVNTEATRHIETHMYV